MLNVEFLILNVNSRPASHSTFNTQHSTFRPLLPRFQQKSLQVFPFRAVDGHGMIGACRQPAQNRNAPAGIDSRGENHLLKKVERYVAGAGEGEHFRARFENRWRTRWPAASSRASCRFSR